MDFLCRFIFLVPGITGSANATHSQLDSLGEFWHILVAIENYSQLKFSAKKSFRGRGKIPREPSYIYPTPT